MSDEVRQNLDISLSARRCKKRWYPLIDHPVQRALVEDDIRFKLVPAGRRSGKTERAKRYIAKKLMSTTNKSYFIAAPTRGQVKKIYWDDMQLLTFSPLLGKNAVSRSDLTIEMPNGNKLFLIGLDEPQRIEGALWAGGVVDEIADVKQDAWAMHIRPALDTYNPQDPDYRAWCWLIGVPDGLNHYYDMVEQAKTQRDPDWKVYTWHSADILPKNLIASARRNMSLKQFKQEYEASFETATGKIYEDYGDHNTTAAKIKPHEQILWMHDFNYSPLSSAIGVIRNETDLYLLDENILTSAVAKQTAMEFCEKYKDHQNKNILIFGDPNGVVGEKHKQQSNYLTIEGVLRKNGWNPTRKVRSRAPAIKDRQNAVRAKILNAEEESSLFVNPKKAPWCHKGLSTVTFKKGSSFLEEETDQQHVTTAIGYCIERIWPIKPEKEEVENHHTPTQNLFKRAGR